MIGLRTPNPPKLGGCARRSVPLEEVGLGRTNELDNPSNSGRSSHQNRGYLDHETAELEWDSNHHEFKWAFLNNHSSTIRISSRQQLDGQPFLNSSSRKRNSRDMDLPGGVPTLGPWKGVVLLVTVVLWMMGKPTSSRLWMGSFS